MRAAKLKDLADELEELRRSGESRGSPGAGNDAAGSRGEGGGSERDAQVVGGAPGIQG